MKVLILAPHADDAEFACGGTISKLVREGHEVHELVFSFSYHDTGTDKLIRAKECDSAAQLLGIYLIPLTWDDEKLHRHFYEYRQDILDRIISWRETIKPDLALIPCRRDKHQDHKVIHAEGVRGLKGVETVLGYEIPWNHMIQANYFVKLTHEDVGKKVEAFLAYKSASRKPYYDPQIIWSLARVRGLQAGCEYAEAFEVIRGGM